MKKINLLSQITLTVILCFAVVGCNMPMVKKVPTATLSVTQAYQTAEAILTKNARLTPVATQQPTPTTSDQPTPTPSASEVAVTTTPTLTPTRTSVSQSCDMAGAGNPIDVTIPDDTKMAPGQSFTKTWRLVNTGSCTWTKAYTVAYFSGERLSAPASVPMPAEVAPGKSVDISVDMVAPQQPGTYTSNWKLRNASGEWFGIGPGGGSPFWVRIIVTTSGTITPTPTGTIVTTTETSTPTSTSTSVTVTPSTPTLTGTAEPPPAASGKANLAVNDVLDLDSGTLNSPGADIGLLLAGPEQHTLSPLGGALLSKGLAKQPNLAKCQSVSLSGSPLIVENLSAGVYLCYLTSQGLYGWLQIKKITTNSDGVTLQFYTWSSP